MNTITSAVKTALDVAKRIFLFTFKWLFSNLVINTLGLFGAIALTGPFSPLSALWVYFAIKDTVQWYQISKFKASAARTAAEVIARAQRPA